MKDQSSIDASAGINTNTLLTKLQEIEKSSKSVYLLSIDVADICE